MLQWKRDVEAKIEKMRKQKSKTNQPKARQAWKLSKGSKKIVRTNSAHGLKEQEAIEDRLQKFGKHYQLKHEVAVWREEQRYSHTPKIAPHSRRLKRRGKAHDRLHQLAKDQANELSQRTLIESTFDVDTGELLFHPRINAQSACMWHSRPVGDRLHARSKQQRKSLEYLRRQADNEAMILQSTAFTTARSDKLARRCRGKPKSQVQPAVHVEEEPLFESKVIPKEQFDELLERNQHWIESKNEKIQKLQADLEAAEMDECSNPALEYISGKTYSKVKNNSEYYKKSIAWARRIEDDVSDKMRLKDRNQFSECTFQPKTNINRESSTKKAIVKATPVEVGIYRHTVVV